MLRAFLTILLTPLYTVLAAVPAMILSLVRPGGPAIEWCARPWARAILLTAGIRISASGLENLEKDRTYIYLSNHQSNLDILAIILTLPDRFRVVAKRPLFYIPVFGQALWLMGMIPIDRSRRDRAIASLESAAARIRRGTPVLFFAEGTRSRDGTLLPFKKGAFVVAAQAGVPVVPITIDGTARLLPKGSLRTRPGTISIHYGRPIPTDRYTVRTKEGLMEEVRQAMLSRLGQRETRSGGTGAAAVGAGETGSGPDRPGRDGSAPVR